MSDSKLTATTANIISMATNDGVHIELRSRIIRDSIKEFTTEFANILKNINETSINEKDRAERIFKLCDQYGFGWQQFSNKFF